MPTISNDTIRLIFRVRDNTSAGIRSIGRGLSRLTSGIGSVTRGLLSIGGLGGILGGVGFGVAVNESANLAAEINNVSRQLDLTTDRFQTLFRVASSRDPTLRMEDFGDALRDVVERITEANTLGEGDLFESAQAAGLNSELTESNEIIEDLIVNFRNLDKEDALFRLRELAGDSAFEQLESIISLTADEFDRLAETADNLGLIIEPESLTNLQRMQRSLGVVQSILSTIVVELVADLAPAIERAALTFAAFVSVNGGAAELLGRVWQRVTEQLNQMLITLNRIPGVDIELLGGESQQRLSVLNDEIDGLSEKLNDIRSTDSVITIESIQNRRIQNITADLEDLREERDLLISGNLPNASAFNFDGLTEEASRIGSQLDATLNRIADRPAVDVSGQVDRIGQVLQEADTQSSEFAVREMERQRDASASYISNIEERFDEALRIERDFQRAADRVEQSARVIGLDVQSDDIQSILLSLDQERLDRLDEYYARERELSLQAAEEERRQIEEASRLRTEAFESRSAARDFSSLVNFDTSRRGLETGLAEIQRLFLSEIKEINLATNLPMDEKQRLVQEAQALKQQLESELEVNATVMAVQTGLGIAGDFGSSLGSLAQSSADSALERFEDTTSRQEDARQRLLDALRSGDELEVASARQKLTALTALAASEERLAQRKFKRNQNIQRLNTIINTAAGAMAAFNETKGDIGVKLAAAGAAVAAGAVQLKAINDTKLQQPSASAGGATNQQIAAARDNFNQGSNQRPINLTLPEGRLVFSRDDVIDVIDQFNEQIRSGNAEPLAVGAG